MQSPFDKPPKNYQMHATAEVASGSLITNCCHYINISNNLESADERAFKINKPQDDKYATLLAYTGQIGQNTTTGSYSWTTLTVCLTSSVSVPYAFPLLIYIHSAVWCKP